MSQRFEEDFNKLGNIYEAYFAKKAGGQSDIVQGSPSYRKGYMQPGGSVNSYAANEIPTGVYSRARLIIWICLIS